MTSKVLAALGDAVGAWQTALWFATPNGWLAGGGFPRFKARRGDDSFTIPQNVRVRDDVLSVPKVGRVRLSRRGGNPHAGYPPVKATVKRVNGKWYCVVVYRVCAVARPDNGLALGVDMNCGQVAASTGDLLRLPDMARLQARKRRYQRMVARRRKGSNRRNLARHRLARTQRRIATIRHRWHHETSRILAGTAGLLAIEDLNTKAMTRSARGSAEHPGSNVRQKAGLNREILNTGWSQLRQMLEYKAARVEAGSAHVHQPDVQGLRHGRSGEPQVSIRIRVRPLRTRGQRGRECRVEYHGVGDRRDWTARSVGAGHSDEPSTCIRTEGGMSRQPMYISPIFYRTHLPQNIRPY